MHIKADNVNIVYCGRIDFSDRERPEFIYSLSSFEIRFKGEGIIIYLENKNAYYDNYIGYILDGVEGSFKLKNKRKTEIKLYTDKNIEIHDFILFKRQDACHKFTFSGMEIQGEGELLKPGNCLKRRIEVFGDSVSSGDVVEATDYEGKEDPAHNGEYSNAYHSYPAILSRMLNASCHNTSQSGAALLDNTGWFLAPNCIGMESIYNKLNYNPELGEVREWDFSLYTPNLVIVAIGQNDAHPHDYMKEDYNSESSKKWRRAYAGFLKKLREKYEKAFIICITTLLIHDKSWDRAIDEAVLSLEDDRIKHFTFKRNSRATPGHLRINESKEMADELYEYIGGISTEVWDD